MNGGYKNKSKEENLFLLFILFFCVAIAYFTVTDAFWEKEIEKKSLAQNEELFLYSLENVIDTTDLFFEQGNAVFAGSAPCFGDVSVLGSRGIKERDSIISYCVEEGNTLEDVAQMFGISVDTIKWANNIGGKKIKEGEELLILPVTGVMYYVERGDTLGEIARMHKADLEDIIAFNEIEGKKIIAGDRLIIPEGKPAPTPVISSPSSQIVRSSFVNPVPGGVITQGLHPYNAVDIYNPCGSIIVAAASGRVTQVGWGSWPAGNFVKIDHGHVVALYAHMQTITVRPGNYVSQGKGIGTVGNTGKTIGRTGCHLHFDILSKRTRNPFAHLSIGARP